MASHARHHRSSGPGLPGLLSKLCGTQLGPPGTRVLPGCTGPSASLRPPIQLQVQMFIHLAVYSFALNDTTRGRVLLGYQKFNLTA